ncbi:MAG: hypothetical protein QOI31_1219 [Solirubrobacterales bacterium]|jgi:hypothetical protein|nr:hypothetical protein [Solirubrobacterales bacterium]
MYAVEAIDTRGALSTGDRMVAAFLWILMAVGSFAMWVAVPAAWLWVAGKITSDQAQHITLSVIGVPLAIIIWARGLFWLNRLHMRVTMPRLIRELEEAPDDEPPRPIRGALEPLMVGSLAIAILAMAIWFFFFAETPPSTLAPS